MLGFQLFNLQEGLGALNPYSSRPGAFTEHTEHVGWVFATHAAVAFASARNDEQLHEAIDTRQRIGRAVGILVERYEISEDQAFEVLKESSQRRNVKLRDVAFQLVETGELPDAQGR